MKTKILYDVLKQDWNQLLMPQTQLQNENVPNTCKAIYSKLKCVSYPVVDSHVACNEITEEGEVKRATITTKIYPELPIPPSLSPLSSPPPPNNSWYMQWVSICAPALVMYNRQMKISIGTDSRQCCLQKMWLGRTNWEYPIPKCTGSEPNICCSNFPKSRGGQAPLPPP